MTITAKFPGRCSECGGAVRPGDQIEWTRGVKAVTHSRCAPANVDAATAAPSASEAPAAPAGRSITVERVGRRSYLRGETLAVRGMLRSAGCHWDADARAWWIGSHETALELAERGRTAQAEAAPPRPRCCVACGARESRDSRGYPVVKILRSGECVDCYEERRMGY